jgi:triacylglycerol lipase
MIRTCARATFRSSTTLKRRQIPPQRFFSCTQWRREDPRLDGSGRKITDEFAEMREKYSTVSHPKMTRTKADSFQTLQYVPMTIERRPSKHVQKHTIILAHGLLGFDELRLAGHYFPGLHYWRGITEALSHNGIEVIVAAVPASGSIEARAAKLAESIAQKAKGKQVNIIAYVE